MQNSCFVTVEPLGYDDLGEDLEGHGVGWRLIEIVFASQVGLFSSIWCAYPYDAGHWILHPKAQHAELGT